MVYKITNVVKRLAFLLTIFLVLLNTTFAKEQDDEWQVLLYSDNQILRVTADGLTDSIVLPDAAQDIQSGNTAQFIGLSPDERYLAFVTEERKGDSFTATLHIADLTADTCCTVVPSPDDKTWEVINIGMFSPDSRYMVVNALNAYIADYDVAIAVLDLQTGEWVTVMNPTEMFNTNALFFIDWTDAGIEVKPSCFPCGASADGMTLQWNPFTNELTEDYAYYAAAMGSRLGNGEIIQAAQDTNLPLSNADAMVGPFNVIEYFTQDTVDAPETIYFDADNLHLIDPEWVIDGQAYLIQEPDLKGGILVWRDGQTLPLEYHDVMLLTGTPDGWLMTNLYNGELVQFQWLDGELIMTELGAYLAPKLLQTPILGESVTTPMEMNSRDL